MYHWQWFILVITISFVVSNGGERINTRRSISIDPSFKKKRETNKPEKLSTHVRYPLWVTISGLGSVGGETQYKKIDDKLYEFTLPFVVLVKESDVNANRSAVQDPNLAYPFWVEISEVHGEYANQTVEGSVRLAFPFDLEVARMSLMGTNHGVAPASRIFTEFALVGTISIAGTIAVGVAVIVVVVGAIVVTHVLRAIVSALWQAAVEIFRPHDHSYGQIERPKSLVGAVVGSVAGAIVSFVPGLRVSIIAGITHIFQTFGDSLVTFVKGLFRLYVIGDIICGINVVINIFYSLPFVPWRVVPARPVVGVLPPPPPIIVPVLPPPPPPTDIQKLVIQIYYGQETIPGLPEYIIVWPGKQEPPNTDLIILRPITPTLPYRPNIRLVWPVQATNNVRPNLILIRPGQRLIPGYVNVVIVWSKDGPVPLDPDLIVIRPNDKVIPNIIGALLMWPGQVPENGPCQISLLPGQRQHPQFPTIIFLYPGDPPPPDYPSITFATPPAPDLSGYPGIKIIWPPELQSPSEKYPEPGPIMIGPDDFQVPGHPNTLIVRPGQPRPRPMPGISYVVPGQPTIPEVPGSKLQWPEPQGPTEQFPFIKVEIPPRLVFVPGFPDYPIDRPGAPASNNPKAVKPGDKTLPDNPNVFLVWLDRPTDLVLESSPDIMQNNYFFQEPETRAYKRKRAVKRSISELPAFLNHVHTSASEFLRAWKAADLTDVTYGPGNTTVDAQQLDKSIGGYDKVIFGYEKGTKHKSWELNIKKSYLKQWFKQLFSLSCQG